MPVHQMHRLSWIGQLDNVLTIKMLSSGVIVSLEVGKADPDGVALGDLNCLDKLDWIRIKLRVVRRG